MALPVRLIFMACLALAFVIGPSAESLAQARNSHGPTPSEGPAHPNILWVYLEDTNPWMSTYGDTVVQTPHIDALAGAGVGVLGAVYGTTVGLLAPRGKARGLVLGLHWTLLAIGVVLLAAGITALATGQPYGVWYALLLPGGLVTILMVVFLPIVRLRYQQARQRRLEAEEFRRG